MFLSRTSPAQDDVVWGGVGGGGGGGGLQEVPVLMDHSQSRAEQNRHRWIFKSVRSRQLSTQSSGVADSRAGSGLEGPK